MKLEKADCAVTTASMGDTAESVFDEIKAGLQEAIKYEKTMIRGEADEDGTGTLEKRR